MDSKNVIAAIALSSAVIVLYSLFFIPEQSSTKKNLVEKNKIEQNTDTPILDEKETLVKISREDALKESGRVKFENQSVIGSISLKGALIDDLTLKDYKVSLESDKKIKPNSNDINHNLNLNFVFLLLKIYPIGH